jgi:hypothetical protein
MGVKCLVVLFMVEVYIKFADYSRKIIELFSIIFVKGVDILCR